jgi:hypothetical protein
MEARPPMISPSAEQMIRERLERYEPILNPELARDLAGLIRDLLTSQQAEIERLTADRDKAVDYVWPQDVPDLIDMARDWGGIEGDDLLASDVLIHKLGNALDVAQGEIARLKAEAARELEGYIADLRIVRERTEQAEAARERLREALVKVRAHTSYVNPSTELLAGLLQSVERITDAVLSTPARPTEEP